MNQPVLVCPHRHRFEVGAQKGLAGSETLASACPLCCETLKLSKGLWMGQQIQLDELLRVVGVANIQKAYRGLLSTARVSGH
jgi:hypothetical protein